MSIGMSLYEVRNLHGLLRNSLVCLPEFGFVAVERRDILLLRDVYYLLKLLPLQIWFQANPVPARI
jgi:hypothetical protein